MVNLTQNLSSQDTADDVGKANTSYFWDETEHLKFVSIFQRNGRKWKAISQSMDKRGTLQCRTHGQKYLQSLRTLLDQIEQVLAEHVQPSKEFCILVHKYETERRKLLQQYYDAEIDDEKWFPEYILDKKRSTLTFTKKLEQISPTILALLQNQ